MECDIHSIVRSLSKKREVFFSEADFQFALAWEIQTFFPNLQIRLEYCPVEIDPSMHLDVIVKGEHSFIPIELKYKTLDIDVTVAGERYALKNHSAPDGGRYDFLKDISRIEKLVMQHAECQKGYAIFLTNVQTFWNPPVRDNANDMDFKIHQGARKWGRLAWAEQASMGTRNGRLDPIVLAGEYLMEWRDYSSLPQNPRRGLFKYLCVEIKKHEYPD